MTGTLVTWMGIEKSTARRSGGATHNYQGIWFPKKDDLILYVAEGSTKILGVQYDGWELRDATENRGRDVEVPDTVVDAILASLLARSSTVKYEAQFAELMAA